MGVVVVIPVPLDLRQSQSHYPGYISCSQRKSVGVKLHSAYGSRKIICHSHSKLHLDLWVAAGLPYLSSPSEALDLS